MCMVLKHALKSEDGSFWQGSFHLLPLGLVDGSGVVHAFQSLLEYHMMTHTAVAHAYAFALDL